MIDQDGKFITRKEGFEEKIEQMKRDGKAFYLCEDTINKIKELSMESDSIAGINWLIENYQMVGEEVVRLREEKSNINVKIGVLGGANKDLTAEVFELKRKNKAAESQVISLNEDYSNCCINLEEIRNDLKESKEVNKELKSELDKSYKSLNASSFEKTKFENKYIESVERNAALTKENRELKTNYEKMTGLAVSKVDLKNEYKEKWERVYDENEELKKERVGLVDEIGEYHEKNYDLEKENNELKESLRTIQEMDKEEPCAQVETLLEDVQRLTTENRKLEDENGELKHDLEKSKHEAFSEHNSAFDYRMHFIEAEGQIKAYQWALETITKKRCYEMPLQQKLQFIST